MAIERSFCNMLSSIWNEQTTIFCQTPSSSGHLRVGKYDFDSTRRDRTERENDLWTFGRPERKLYFLHISTCRIVRTDVWCVFNCKKLLLDNRPMNFVYYYYTRGFGVFSFIAEWKIRQIQPNVQTSLRRKNQDLHLCSQKNEKKKKQIEMQVHPFIGAVLALCGVLIEKVKNIIGSTNLWISRLYNFHVSSVPVQAARPTFIDQLNKHSTGRLLMCAAERVNICLQRVPFHCVYNYFVSRSR